MTLYQIDILFFIVYTVKPSLRLKGISYMIVNHFIELVAYQLFTKVTICSLPLLLEACGTCSCTA
jgi:hypothetical protein